MSKPSDFSAEDDAEGQTTIQKAAEGELARLKAHLKYQDRRAKALFKRALGRHERLRLKQKYNPKEA